MHAQHLGHYLKGQGHSLTLNENHVQPITKLFEVWLNLKLFYRNDWHIETTCLLKLLALLYTTCSVYQLSMFVCCAGECSARCRTCVRHWSHRSYTLVHDTDTEGSEFALDLVFYLGCQGETRQAPQQMYTDRPKSGAADFSVDCFSVMYYLVFAHNYLGIDSFVFICICIYYIHIKFTMFYQYFIKTSIYNIKPDCWWSHVLVSDWDMEYGGFTSYIAKGEDEEVWVIALSYTAFTL